MSNRVRKNSIKIMVFGTFDGLHPGHIHFLKQAKNLSKGGYLIVSIARDKNVQKIKGRRPVFDEKERKKILQKSAIADKVLLGGIKNHFPHILKEGPHIIALGYDQKAYVKNLKRDLNSAGHEVKIVRLRPYKQKIYKSSLLRKKRLQ